MGDYFDDDDLIEDYIADGGIEEDYDEYADADFREKNDDDPKPSLDQSEEVVGGESGGGGEDRRGLVGPGSGYGEEDNGDERPPTVDDDGSGAEGGDIGIGIGGVPSVVSAPSSSDVVLGGAPLSASSSLDPYGFERYAGRSSWRRPVNGSGGGTRSGDGGGATTMEAAGWKKRSPPSGKTGDGDDSGGISDGSNDGGGGGETKKRKLRGAGVSAGGCPTISASAPGAQLVRFADRRGDDDVLGRSWGVRGDGRRRRGGGDARFVIGGVENDFDPFMPEVGRDSVAVTKADGTMIFVRRNGKGASLRDGNTINAVVPDSSSPGDSAVSTDVAVGDGGGGGSDGKIAGSGEGNLLGLPMSELLRRADVIERRAAKRRSERREREEKKRRKEKGDGANEANDDGKDGDAGVSDVPDGGGEYGEEAYASSPRGRNDNKRVRVLRDVRDLEELAARRKEAQLRQRLWVDKHAPRGISHLLSDERTNREALRALRAWDAYVFRREPPPRPATWFSGGGGVNGKDNDPKGESWHAANKKNISKTNDDGGDGEGNGGSSCNKKADVRPDECSRVILLSGPPGVGKSTLAHIICRHAGYRPVEVNASDERSASALTDRVVRVMESSTLNLGGENRRSDDERGGGGTTSAGRPNCLILDEIDGADSKSSIAALVDIIRADVPENAHKGGSSKGKKKAHRTLYLRRPIIFICNHKHASALRPLLPFAKQFDVQPPNPERLVARLRAVLAAERLSVVAGSMLLHRLVAASGGDVRNCLFSLQFASARARELATRKREREQRTGERGGGEKGEAVMVDISPTLMVALGGRGNMKDIQSDVSSTLSAVFRKEKNRRPQKTRKVVGGGASEPRGAPKNADLVLRAIERFGDNSKALDCLFLNVNRVSYVDPTLDRCAAAFEWLSGADTFRSYTSNASINNGAEHHAMQKFHIPSAAAAVHVLCRVETRPDLTFSTRPMADAHYQKEANVSLVHRFVDGLAPRVRRGVGGGTDVVVSDVIPYGLWLLSAGVGKCSLSRPVSSVDILSSEEKLAFSAHVATLRALGLTYVKEEGTFQYSNPENPMHFRLEPNLEKLVKFEDNGNNSPRRQDVPPPLKELLAHGATLEILRERELGGKKARSKEKENVPSSGIEKIKTSVKPAFPKKSSVANSNVAKNFLGVRAANAKAAKSARRAAKVGFDRSKKTKVSNTGSGVELSKVVRFKYQKGFTQAVRAPCQLDELM